MTKKLLWLLLGLFAPAGPAMAQSCGSGLPYTLTNGTNADATQVMANFNYIVSCYATLQGNTFTGQQILPANPTSALGAATKQYVDAAGGSSGPGAGFANRLRNGTFVSWPKGITGTIATSPTGSAAISANGWAVLPTGASVTWDQVTSGNNGAPQSLKVTGATSVTDVTIAQRIESLDAAALAGKTVTFQVAVYNNTGGSITPTLATRYAGSADNWTSPTADLAATSLQACANGAWTVVAYTFAASANAVNGYEIKIDFGNNFSTTGKYVQISAADLRATPGVSTGLNSSPPVPELPNASAELARNARYFSASYANGTAPGTATTANDIDTIGQAASGSQIGSNGSGFRFPIALRASPTVTIYATSDGSSGNLDYAKPGSANAKISASINGVGANGFLVYSTGASGMSSGQAIKMLFHYTAYADFW